MASSDDPFGDLKPQEPTSIATEDPFGHLKPSEAPRSRSEEDPFGSLKPEGKPPVKSSGLSLSEFAVEGVKRAGDIMNPFGKTQNYIFSLLQKARKEIEGLGDRSIMASRQLQEMLPRHPVLGLMAAVPGTIAGDITKEITAKLLPANRLDAAALLAFPALNGVAEEIESVGIQAIGRTAPGITAQTLRTIMELPDGAELIKTLGPRILGNDAAASLVKPPLSAMAYHDLDSVIAGELSGEGAGNVFKTFKAGVNSMSPVELEAIDGRTVKTNLNSPVGSQDRQLMEDSIKSFNPIQQRAIMRRGAAVLGQPELDFSSGEIGAEEWELHNTVENRERMGQITNDIRTKGMVAPVEEPPARFQPRSNANLAYQKNVVMFRKLGQETRDFLNLNLSDYPVLKNDLLKAGSYPRNAAIFNQIRLREMAEPVLRDSDAIECFRQRVVLNDWIQRARAGQKVMDGVPVEQLEAWRNEASASLKPESWGRVMEAEKNYYALVQSMGDDLIRRGIMSPESRKSLYFHHDVMKYLTQNDPELMRDFPYLTGTGGTGAVKFGPRAPFRSYLKRAFGSTSEIDTDVFRVLHRLMTKISIDNFKDDLVIRASEGFHSQAMGMLDDAQRVELFGNLGVPTRTGEFLLPNGERRVGIRYALRGRIFTEENSDTQLYDRILETASSPEELDRMFGPVGARQAYQKVYLVPTEVANELKKFSLGSARSALHDIAAKQTNLFKRMTLLGAGTGLESKFGFSWLESFIRDLSLRHPIDSLGGVWNIPKAVYLVGKSIALDKPATPLVQRAMEEAGLKLPLSNSPAFDPRFAKAVLPIDNLIRIMAKPLKWGLDAFASVVGGGPRLAKFMADLDTANAGKGLLEKYQPLVGRYWMEPELRGLSAQDQAGAMARRAVPELFTNSRQFNAAFRDLLFPFISFHYHNSINWAKYAMRNPADMGMKFGMIYASMQTWNWSAHPEVERSLSPWQRIRPHVIFGKDEKGKQRIWFPNSSLQDAAGILKLDALAWRMSALAAGQLSMKSLVRGQAREYTSITNNPISSEILGLLNAAPKTVLEVLANQKRLGQKSGPIVPDREQGTTQGLERQIEHMAESLFIPLAGYHRAQMQRDEEQRNPILGYLMHGPGSLDRFIGMQSEGLDRMDRERVYLSEEDARVINSQNYADLEDAYIKFGVTGDASEYDRLIARGGNREIPFGRGKSLRTYLASPRVQIEIAEQKLDRENDTTKRKALMQEIEALENAQSMKSIKRLPIQERLRALTGFSD